MAQSEHNKLDSDEFFSHLIVAIKEEKASRENGVRIFSNFYHNRLTKHQQ